MANLSVALGTARSHLNDDAGNTWTDAVLIPKAQEAHRELQTELWNNGSPVIREVTSAPIVINIGVTSLSFTSTPPLPADLLTPTTIFESSVGGNDWVPMTEYNYIPLGVGQGLTLGIWSWRKEILYFLGSTNQRQISIQYRRLIPIPTLASDPIGIIFGESYIAARTAALAAGAVANAEVLATMTALAKENLAKVLSANRGQQRPVNKP